MNGVGKKIQLAGSHNAGVELAEGTRGGVAGVGKQGVSVGDPFGVDLIKDIEGQKGFAPHFNYRGWVVRAAGEWSEWCGGFG